MRRPRTRIAGWLIAAALVCSLIPIEAATADTSEPEDSPTVSATQTPAPAESPTATEEPAPTPAPTKTEPATGPEIEPEVEIEPEAETEPEDGAEDEHPDHDGPTLPLTRAAAPRSAPLPRLR